MKFVCIGMRRELICLGVLISAILCFSIPLFHGFMLVNLILFDYVNLLCALIYESNSLNLVGEVGNFVCLCGNIYL